MRLIDGQGPADLLTLRAARALAEADLLVVDPAADPGIVSLARRDARRIAPRDMDHSALADGVQVVWITAPGGVEAAQASLGMGGGLGQA